MEIVQVLNLNDAQVRQVTRRLRGERTIAAYFKDTPRWAKLGMATCKLMSAPTQPDSCSYCFNGEEWISNSLPPAPARSSEGDAGLRDQLDGVSTRLARIVATHEAALVRIARLEATFHRGGAAPRSRPRLALPDESERAKANAPKQQIAPRVPPTEEPLPGAPAAIAADPPLASVSAAEDAPAGRELRLPAIAELAQCIGQLVGDNVSAKSAAPLKISPPAGICYAAGLFDDAGVLAGVILMDLKATVYLGGSLMMVPSSQLEKQYRLSQPEDDSVAASSEVCNALSGVINGVQDQHHIRAGALELFDLRTMPWLADPADRRDLEDSLGGRTAVISRRFQRPAST